MSNSHTMRYTCQGKTILLNLCSFCCHMADPGCCLAYPEPAEKTCPSFEKVPDLPRRLDELLQRYGDDTI